MNNKETKLPIATSNSVFSFPSIVCNKYICQLQDVKAKNC